jgi:general secretion pathway protein M
MTAAARLAGEARARLTTATDAARGWLDGRSPRERALLAGLAALAVAGLFFGLVQRPLAAERDRALAEIVRLDATLAAARAAGPAPVAAAAPASPADAAAAHGLTIQRIEPEGARTRIAFEDAAFADLLAWIATVEAGGGRVAALELVRRPAPGMVAATVTLEP